jgi:hypothetical protein
VIALAVWKLPALAVVRRLGPVPPGDLLIVADRSYGFSQRLADKWVVPVFTQTVEYAGRRLLDVSAALDREGFGRAEARLASWGTAGVFLLLTIAALTALLAAR